MDSEGQDLSSQGLSEDHNQAFLNNLDHYEDRRLVAQVAVALLASQLNLSYGFPKSMDLTVLPNH